MKFEVSFVNSVKEPVILEKGSNLSEYLTAENSPILFGCRSGICGTCAIRVVESGPEKLHPRTQNEIDYLEAIAPEEKKCRLACQISLDSNIKIEKVSL